MELVEIVNRVSNVATMRACRFILLARTLATSLRLLRLGLILGVECNLILQRSGTNGSMLLLLCNQRKKFVDCREGYHGQDLTSNLEKRLIQTHEEIMDILILEKLLHCMSIFIIALNQSVRIQFFPENLDLGEVLRDFHCSLIKICELSLELENMWSIAVLKELLQIIPQLRSRICVNERGCNFLRNRIEDPCAPNIVYTIPILDF
ncbi:hypothetical protein PIB30_077128 [Stylosanthes scabra]|uniref:Uncharacterized protein n=1 Tax=Stylosanthes scabra TaxID=79078 RepID=A0ABU6RQQ4_9FABA|nr:hypothetical protein [Stylosanthes scabra]